MHTSLRSTQLTSIRVNRHFSCGHVVVQVCFNLTLLGTSYPDWVYFQPDELVSKIFNNPFVLTRKALRSSVMERIASLALITRWIANLPSALQAVGNSTWHRYSFHGYCFDKMLNFTADNNLSGIVSCCYYLYPTWTFTDDISTPN